MLAINKKGQIHVIHKTNVISLEHLFRFVPFGRYLKWETPHGVLHMHNGTPEVSSDDGSEWEVIDCSRTEKKRNLLTYRMEKQTQNNKGDIAEFDGVICLSPADDPSKAIQIMGPDIIVSKKHSCINQKFSILGTKDRLTLSPIVENAKGKENQKTIGIDSTGKLTRKWTENEDQIFYFINAGNGM